MQRHAARNCTSDSGPAVGHHPSRRNRAFAAISPGAFCGGGRPGLSQELGTNVIFHRHDAGTRALSTRSARCMRMPSHSLAGKLDIGSLCALISAVNLIIIEQHRTGPYCRRAGHEDGRYLCPDQSSAYPVEGRKPGPVPTMCRANTATRASAPRVITTAFASSRPSQVIAAAGELLNGLRRTPGNEEPMYTLGINAAYHDSSACLVQDGRRCGCRRGTLYGHQARQAAGAVFGLRTAVPRDRLLPVRGRASAWSDVHHVAYSYDPSLFPRERAERRTDHASARSEHRARARPGTSVWDPLFLSYIIYRAPAACGRRAPPSEKTLPGRRRARALSLALCPPSSRPCRQRLLRFPLSGSGGHDARRPRRTGDDLLCGWAGTTGRAARAASTCRIPWGFCTNRSPPTWGSSIPRTNTRSWRLPRSASRPMPEGSARADRAGRQRRLPR